MDTLRQDLRLALRLLWKDRAFATTTILTLALCIGAYTGIFSVVRSVLLRPLPYPEPDRLVIAYDGFPGAGVERAGTSVPNYFDRLALTDVLESQALYRFSGLRVGSGESAEGVASMDVTPSFFRVLRASAARGRLFRDEDGEPGRNRVAVFSHAYAERHGGIDAVIGRDFRLNDEKHVVVGVLPRDFTFLNPEIRIWVPLAFSPEDRAEDRRWSQNHDAIGRLAAGATVEQAQSRLDAMNVRLVERAGPLKTALVNAGYHTRVAPLAADVVRNVRAALHLLWGGVMFVLLIAAVNITNLSLVRASGRLKEMATRHALGAARGRVTRQLITETMLVTLAGGTLGLLLGRWSLESLAALGLGDLPRAHEIRLDETVIVSTLGIATMLGIAIGAVPAIQSGGANLSAILREEGWTGTAGKSARRARRVLVTAQVAVAFVLLIGAGLLLASFNNLLAVDPGFKAEHVLTGRVTLLETRYGDDAALRSYTTRALERLRALPGVVATGATSYLPFSWDSSSSVVIPEGYAAAPGESVVSPNQLYVSPGYLETIRVPLRRGRLFTDSDNERAPRVVIIDEPLAQRFWPNLDPIGRRLYLPERPEDVASPGPDVTWLQVVGVVGAVKLKGLVEGEGARAGAYYMPLAQDPARGLAFAVRTSDDPANVTASVRRAIAALDPDAQLFDVFTMSERVQQSLSPRRAPMVLSLAFGLVALLLASLGIYGVLAFQVGQRRREIGIRMALGSDAARIVALVLREGAVLVAVGLASGLIGAAALRSFIAAQLYGVGPLDPLVVGGALALLGLAALAACLGPARRAAKVDPVIALAQP